MIQGRKGQGGALLLTVTDNGQGMSPKALAQLQSALQEKGNVAQNKHIGLDNVVQRLRLLYGEGFQFSIRSAQGALHVRALPNSPQPAGNGPYSRQLSGVTPWYFLKSLPK